MWFDMSVTENVSISLECRVGNKVYREMISVSRTYDECHGQGDPVNLLRTEEGINSKEENAFNFE